ncbi:hypothetical protein C482_19431 [Natrialba chahannaoensis JCM 10990]|uniref:SIMPL domain-containing protein n=1 Tax=Natrialba chahannaoensis JCM 10990 TaxID=1227492 RepID=M0A767_9EURY|nr:SIMPL domain-containing protein [Natrialba chahannaoensis]ELY93178.1 hypothetical protein C482_19431 [Natrialba chahannaoensis JCM 10990]
MDRRQFLAASTVGVAATTAGCLGNVLSSTDEPEQAEEGTSTASVDNTITVAADGEVETEPDRATMSLGVESVDESADAVSDDLATRSEQLREAFDDLGIPEDNIEEGRYSVRPSRAARREEGVEEFVGTHSYQVTLDDVERVGEVIDAAVDAGADDVGRVNFTVQDETRAELRKDAIDDALAMADEEAEHIASNRGVELTGTTAVTTSDVRVSTVRHDVAYETDDAADAAPETEIDADPVSITASATVEYGFSGTGE